VIVGGGQNSPTRRADLVARHKRVPPAAAAFSDEASVYFPSSSLGGKSFRMSSGIFFFCRFPTSQLSSFSLFVGLAGFRDAWFFGENIDPLFEGLEEVGLLVVSASVNLHQLCWRMGVLPAVLSFVCVHIRAISILEEKLTDRNLNFVSRKTESSFDLICGVGITVVVARPSLKLYSNVKVAIK